MTTTPVALFAPASYYHPGGDVRAAGTTDDGH
ncbi:hypothetical protein J2Z21_000005 [Streptomyces griseochromogenes]|uniref:Uncharacterized protein n=1 Tax=Streptomyces griseochromogenes TaxID=68214 RepID=A0ABS4LI90_9ACTN|nr:hypothetical protein [Streptomyces griseochromogenes]